MSNEGQAPQPAGVVYCQLCSVSWNRSSYGFTCPLCNETFTEIVSLALFPPSWTNPKSLATHDNIGMLMALRLKDQS
jgi:hypothetical protein